MREYASIPPLSLSLIRRVAVVAICVAFVLAATRAVAVQPYSGTVWRTVTLPPASGVSSTSTARTEVSRDASGATAYALYRATPGGGRDASGLLLVTSTTQGHLGTLFPSMQAERGEKLTSDVQLGTRSFDGIEAAGERRSLPSHLPPGTDAYGGGLDVSRYRGGSA